MNSKISLAGRVTGRCLSRFLGTHEARGRHTDQIHIDSNKHLLGDILLGGIRLDGQMGTGKLLRTDVADMTDMTGLCGTGSIWWSIWCAI